MVRFKQTARKSAGAGTRRAPPVRAGRPANPVGRRRVHRVRPGTKSLREIREQQKSVKFCLRKAPFQRLVREICQDMSKTQYRFQASALEALQEAAEVHLIERYQKSMLCVLHAKRVTLMPKDMILARKLEGNLEKVD